MNVKQSNNYKKGGDHVNKKIAFVALVMILTVVFFAATAAAHTPPGIAISQAASGRIHPLSTSVEEPGFTTMGISAGPAGVWDIGPE